MGRRPVLTLVARKSRAFDPGNPIGFRTVLPFETVDNWSSLCKPTSDRFFHQGAVQTGHPILEKCSIRGLLLAPSSTCPRDAPSPSSGLRATQAQTGSKG